MKIITTIIILLFIYVPAIVTGDEGDDLIENIISTSKAMIEEIEVDRTNENKIIIFHDTMLYHIHVPDKLGRMQQWHKKIGPNNNGLIIEISIKNTSYSGPMELPQKLPRAYSPYWDTYIYELEINSKYYYITVMFGENIKANQRNEILELIN